jgi:ribokinase
MIDVLVAGEIFEDLILSGFDSWPAPGQEAFARDFHREIGGGAAITACGLAKLGVHTGVIAALGSDGARVAAELGRAGVDTSAIHFEQDQPTAFTVAVSTPQERAFFTYPGANRAFQARFRQYAGLGGFAGARHVHLAFAPDLDTADSLLTDIRSVGATVSLDLGWHECWLRDARALELLRQVDLFFPNELEAACMTAETDPGRALEKLFAAGVRRVALKLGERGAALLWDGGFYRADPFKVEPVDTTGAGDCFDAGFLYAWLRGAEPEMCLRVANVCGALSTQSHGGLTGFPGPAQLEEALKKTL